MYTALYIFTKRLWNVKRILQKHTHHEAIRTFDLNQKGDVPQRYMSEFPYSAKDIARILRRESEKQNVFFRKGYRMSTLLFLAAVFLEAYVEREENLSQQCGLKGYRDFTLNSNVELD